MNILITKWISIPVFKTEIDYCTHIPEELFDHVQDLGGSVQNSTFVGTSPRKLYSSSDDRSIKQWSLSTGECEQTLQGHTDYISYSAG